MLIERMPGTHPRNTLTLTAKSCKQTFLCKRIYKVEGYTALPKKNLAPNITLNKIYNTYDLLIQHEVLYRILLSNKKKPLLYTLDDIGLTPPQVPSKDRTPIRGIIIVFVAQ
ncbi:unnamed protein product [Rhizophagus irregularis]|uniref:Uncharacterized protein n=2 Tax=Rhizophagus irregularis TaxID=588596 RepID=A0A915ZKH8_9GLOM|nr:unnamed protein product [Rhizophagus irregularis]CAB5203984.1 unnamed protein product [Rhizophagus irregularis]CAB5380843.1 unnamed protein product [Rhizophagus irregularis]